MKVYKIYIYLYIIYQSSYINTFLKFNSKNTNNPLRKLAKGMKKHPGAK
jgi:hypothetical protein